MEEWIGSVWLQNAGSVLLLLGVLFLILWGYNTGRFGPGVLVAAGVVLGALIAWRGDRVVPALPAFGFAIVGIGVGTVYLTLCLGHFHLHVLSRGVALALLALASMVTILLGQRYRAQYFAILGVLGAHLPPLLGLWAPLTAFAFPASELVGYLAAVNLVVYVLAWRSGWSALNLVAVVLTTGTWMACAGEGAWTWPTQIALTALYLGLGLAPLPFLRRAAGLGGVELGVVGAAPLGLVLTSSPFVFQAARGEVALWSGGLFLAYVAAAWWADRGGAQRDLWKILTAAATLFLTLALERAVGAGGTPIAWSLEGLLLVAFGLRASSGWLRLCGHVVQFFAAVTLLGGSLDRLFLEPGPPIVGFYGIRNLICAGLVAAGAHLLWRSRARLDARERYAAEAWTLVANGMLAGWVAGESRNLAHGIALLDAPGGRPPDAFPFLSSWMLAVTGFGWYLQSAANVALGIRRQSRFLLGIGHAVGALAFLCAAGALSTPVPWTGSPWPSWLRSGGIALASTVLATGIARWLADHRGTAPRRESVLPEAWTLAANVLWVGWIAREAGHLAFALRTDYPSAGEVAGLTGLSATATALGWTVQAAVLLLLGLRERSPLLRKLAHAVGALLLFLLLLGLAAEGTWRPGFPPILHPTGVIPLLSLAAISGLTLLLWKRRSELDVSEARAPELWLAGLTLLWMVWMGREATHFASLWTGALGIGRSSEPASSIWLVAASFGWMVLATTQMRIGLRRGEAFVRVCATAVALAALWTLFVSLFSEGTWRPGAAPVLHPTGLLSLGALLLGTYLTASLRSSRARLSEPEQRAPNVWAAAVSLVWMAWTAREAGNAAQFVVGTDDAARVATLAAALTSAGWLLHSLVLMGIGWVRSSAFLRWAGLLLLGATVVKFLLHDLRTVDLFWRFLTAALVGAALLAISYAYQRRRAATGAEKARREGSADGERTPADDSRTVG